ncbi:unnamed protein product [Bursaphelenchus xylophilus]|uniref:(pine wood nematode) hypothetical protein n=1 Tax=Bursaphelenchus xylophilus TaxID=6326 RepID=A0A1I7S1Q8_BURXY|nr:unnamed protein product [Bursaphelenchus xylophilus]CAG9089803.1 unnamed protein product [Bursaphelenchus xylophilus]
MLGEGSAESWRRLTHGRTQPKIPFTIHTSPNRGNPKYLSLTRNVVAPKSNRLFFVISVSKNLSSASLRLFTAYDKKGGSRTLGITIWTQFYFGNSKALSSFNMQLLSLVVVLTALVLTTAQWHGSCQTEKECGAECAKFCGSSTYIQQCADGNPGGCDCLCQSPCMREKGRSCQTVFLYYAKDRRH